MRKTHIFYIVFFVIYTLFVAGSFLLNYESGQQTGYAFFKVFWEMIKILPCAFILIGLFEVWVDKNTVIKHLGEDSGLKGILWMLILAGFTVGGLYVAFPLAETLYKKGASLKTIFIYLGFAGICRIPMTIFEISFLGLPFTLVRLLVTIPLFILAGMILGHFLKSKGYKFSKTT